MNIVSLAGGTVRFPLIRDTDNVISRPTTSDPLNAVTLQTFRKGIVFI